MMKGEIAYAVVEQRLQPLSQSSLCVDMANNQITSKQHDEAEEYRPLDDHAVLL